MKKKTFPNRLVITTLIMCLGVISCNKPSDPPIVIGTWSLGATINGNRIEALVDFNVDTYNHLHFLEERGELPDGLSETIKEAGLATVDAITDLKTIQLLPDGTFTFTFASTPPATGTYEQDGIYVKFKCKTNHYSEVDGSLVGVTNGIEMEMLLSSLTLMPHFLPFFTIEETDLIFNTPNPTSGLGGSLLFTLTSRN